MATAETPLSQVAKSVNCFTGCFVRLHRPQRWSDETREFVANQFKYSETNRYIKSYWISKLSLYTKPFVCVQWRNFIKWTHNVPLCLPVKFVKLIKTSIHFSKGGLWNTVVRFPPRTGILLLFLSTSRPALGPTKASYSMGTEESFTGGKAAKAWSWSLTYI